MPFVTGDFCAAIALFCEVRPNLDRMWNLYSITTNQDAVRRLFGVTTDSARNLPPMPGAFPDYEAPVVRTMMAAAN